MSNQISSINRRRYDSFFGIEAVVCLCLFAMVGLYFKSIKMTPIPIDEKQIAAIKTKFVMAAPAAKPKPALAAPKPIEKTEPEKPLTDEKPIDLRKPVVLDQKQDDIVLQQQKTSGTVVRRVYGLRKVYSMGLGAGGSAGDAVIGKLGNTLNTAIDTVKATHAELKGALASVTTVTVMPKLLKRVKVEYTEEMRKNRIEGEVKAELLIDIDGSVKEVKILNELGLGTSELVKQALLQHKFSPAMRGAQPVAVWILYTYSFQMLEG